jgi:cytochrome b pre-mRNA-processing protein 3
MDHSLREMGVGDLALPRRMKALGEAFYGRARSYDRALAGGDHAALIAALARNVFATEGEPAGARRLAAYVAAAQRRLAAHDDARLGAAALDFPDPTTISDGAGEDAREAMAGGQ